MNISYEIFLVIFPYKNKRPYSSVIGYTVSPFYATSLIALSNSRFPSKLLSKRFSL